MFRLMIQFILWVSLLFLVILFLTAITRRVGNFLFFREYRKNEEERESDYQAIYRTGYTAGYNQAVLESEDGPIHPRYEKPSVKEVPGSWSD